MLELSRDDNGLLDKLQWETFEYFLKEVNPANGLIADKTRDDWPASIAATGLALAAYPVGVERGFMTRDAAVRITLTTLRFFRDSPQGTRAGRHRLQRVLLPLPRHEDRAARLAVRAVDGRLRLPAGRRADGRRLFRSTTYGGSSRSERSPTSSIAAPIGDGRRTAGRRSRTAASRKRASSSIGGRATTRRCSSTCSAWDRRPIRCPTKATRPGCPRYAWKKIYDYEFVYAGPLFIHQLSHIWIDFRGIQDAYMREKGLDYFENSRRATYVQREYAIHNPLEFALYGKDCWGITASDGPGPAR